MSSQPARVGSIESPRRMLGRYELIGELGSGGMGVVYLGRLQGVGGFERMFAIKVLHKHLAQKPQIVSMLLNEARLAAQIQHPNVVSTVDADVSSEGQYYVVMEYVDGFTLCDLLEHPTLDALRRVRLGLRIALDATAGLDAAHRLCNPADATPLGLVHRDVSPNNILVSLQGTGMIADFGIARATAAQDDSMPGVIKGTPSYMAPEQLAGLDTLDARADVFGLGAVLWEVLTGEQLFYSPAGVGGVLALVQNGEILAPSCRNSRIPAALDAVCLKALERDLDRRYQSARELCEDLERVGREYDLIASPHEIADALPGLFAEQIEHRRASLPAADVSSSALVRIPETLKNSPPPPALPSRQSSSPLAVDAGEPPRPIDAGLVDDLPLSLPRERPPWLLLAAVASALIAAAALPWLAREQARAEDAERQRTAVQSAPNTAAAEQPGPGAEAESEGAIDEVAPTAIAVMPDPELGLDLPAPALQPEPSRGRDRVLTSTGGIARRPRVRPSRAAPVPRAAEAPALPAGIAPFDPTSARPSAEDEREGVLETNPYLMQR
jgi:serine/threonine-protein kinase